MVKKYRAGVTTASTEERQRIDFIACWQPIEIAPKDGTQILLAESGWYAGPGWWDGDQWVFLTAIRNKTRGFINSWFADCGPTHWMPLPEPPPERLMNVDARNENAVTAFTCFLEKP